MQISSSRKQTGRGGSKSSTTSSVEPSLERLSRITSALSWDRSSLSNLHQSSRPPTFDPEEIDVQLSQRTHLEEICSDAVDISDEIEIEKNIERLSIGFDSETLKSHGGNNKEESSTIEETEMRKTAQALFELEESLLDQHITNIKVS